VWQIPRSGTSSNTLNRVSSLTILGFRRPPPLDFFLKKSIGKMLYFSAKKRIIHSHRVLNPVSSSTDKTNLLGPIPSRLRSVTPHVRVVCTRAVVSHGTYHVTHIHAHTHTPVHRSFTSSCTFSCHSGRECQKTEMSTTRGYP
jgi:hypothetical protein